MLTIIKIKSIIFLWLLLTLAVALIGRELLANMARFEREEAVGEEAELIISHDL
jgi:hypothetical protein